MEHADLAGPHGFRHIRRGLEAGETLPRCPLLVEQLLAITSGNSRRSMIEADPVGESEVDDDDDFDA